MPANVERFPKERKELEFVLKSGSGSTQILKKRDQ